MKVLLLYSFDNHCRLLDTLALNLKKNGIEADTLNISAMKFRSFSQESGPLLLRLLAPFTGISFFRKAARFLFQKMTILSLARDYGIIDIHFLSPVYHDIIPRLRKMGKKVKVTVWGSDFYRALPEKTERQRNVYSSVDIIQAGTLQMKSDFLEKFPEYEQKIRIARFGIKMFDIIEELDVSGNRAAYRQELGIPAAKLTVTCGYNGSRVQRHDVIFKAVSRLSPEARESIFLIIPMTYGTPKGYSEEVAEEVKKTGVQYRIITSSLDERRLAMLRLSTDIAVNIQVSDAFSASVQEQIFAGSIVIAGNWLPYSLLKEQGIYFIETGLESLAASIESCVAEYKACQAKCIDNRERIRKLSSWQSAVTDWVNIYGELAHG